MQNQLMRKIIKVRPGQTSKDDGFYAGRSKHYETLDFYGNAHSEYLQYIDESKNNDRKSVLYN